MFLEKHFLTAENPKGTIVFCHGAWHNAHCWGERFLNLFKENGYNVVYFSFRNHGESHIGKFIRIKDYVEDLEHVINSIETDLIHLVGHSMGGHIVLKYLENPSPKINSTILLCPIPYNGVWRTTLKVGFHYPVSLLKCIISFSLKPLMKDYRIFKRFFYDDTFNEKELRSYYAEVELESYWAYLDMLFLDLIKSKKIKNPLFLISAEHDYLFSAESLKKSAEKLNATYKNYENTCHNIFTTHVRETLVKDILRFIETEKP